MAQLLRTLGGKYHTFASCVLSMFQIRSRGSVGSARVTRSSTMNHTRLPNTQHNTCVQAQEYHVTSVPYWEWDELEKGGAKAKEKYMRNLIEQHQADLE